MSSADVPLAAGGRLTVDLNALVDNWRFLSAKAAETTTAAVVKANAYGIGLEPAASALSRAGCHTFFVALPAEGIRLRKVVGNAAIYVLDGLLPGIASEYEKAELRPVLGSWPEIEEWSGHLQNGGQTSCAIHVDTGMNRLGLSLAETRQLSAHRNILDLINPDLVISHLATADTPDHPLNRKQLTAFRAVRALLPGIPASLANSAGIMLGQDYHFDLVRPGISLYGGSATGEISGALNPVVTLEARITQVRNVKPGETIGYGASQTAQAPMRVAILATGYADGYHRLAGSSDQRTGARTFLHGQHAPLVGRISMDLLAVDVTHIPAAARGDWAELMGPNIPLDEVAGHAGTIGYELLTGLGHRFARSYVGGERHNG